MAGGTPAPRPQRLGLSVGLGYLGSAGMNGGALSLGLRYAPIRLVALSFDLGYGVLAAPPGVQDRWWLMPAVALVLPLGPVRLDVGAGLGLGASSGYRSWAAYVAGPFDPVWAFQLVPAARGHVSAALPLSRCCDGFARAELGGLILSGSSIGSRVGGDGRTLGDRLWFQLALGVHFRLL